MESIISTFHIDWKIIIAQAVNFGVVFVVLYIFALKPLSKLMADRSEKIKRGIDDAKVNAEILKKTELQSEEILAKARKEADRIFQEGKKETEAHKMKMMEETKAQVALVMENGKKMMEAEKVKMVGEAKNELASLALLAAQKIMTEKNK